MAQRYRIYWQCGRYRRHWFNSWVRKIPWRREWQPTPVFLPEATHGQRSLSSYSPWSSKESDMTEATEHACIFFSLHVFFSFSHQVVCFIILDSFYTSVLADFLWHRLGRGRGVKTEDRHPSPLPLLTLQGSPSDCWAQWEFQYPLWAPAIPLVGLVTDLLGWMSWFPSWPSLPPRQQQSVHPYTEPFEAWI